MINFKNDYSVGAHPNILKKLLETNLSNQMGYGDDEYSAEAKELLKQKIGNANAKIYFLSGGTQTNLTVITYLLRIHEAVISAKTGHIFANETGAIEATGHRVITIETENGKLSPEMLQQVLADYSLRPHVVKPKMVYISNSTELGTVYTKGELENISNFCKKKNLFLFLDGARLGQGLTSKKSDLTLGQIAQTTDIFYIGGTKNGALLGEAVVFNDPDLGAEFDFALKQKGALLAKGRILGIQFLELFKNDLYFELANHANEMVLKMADAIKEKGFSFLTEPVSNQIFPVFPDEIIDELAKKFQFYVWKKVYEKSSAIRLITSWAAEAKDVDEFITEINKL